MVTSAFSGDRPDSTTQVVAAFEERPAEGVRVRLQPQLLRRSGYQTWRDVRWSLDCESPADVYALRDTLRLFFDAINREGLAATRARLAGLPVVSTPNLEAP